MKKPIQFAGVCIVMTCLIGAFSQAQPGATTHPATTSPSDVHTLNTPQFDPELPPGDGRNIVLVRCAVCHTPHYILNQPAFSRKVWTAEVTKMTTAFGAPIPDDDAAKIINYLVAVHGQKDQ